MTTKSDKFLIAWLPLLFTTVVVSFIFLIRSPSTAHAAEERCNVVIALDKSPSIGATNLATLKTHIGRVVDNLEDLVPEKDIYVAYWSFSHDDDSVDYNLPRQDYVPVSDTAKTAAFKASLPNADELRGQTDYAQAFGYSAGNPDINAIYSINDIVLSRNTRTTPDSSESSASAIGSQAHVIVILTDGAPNYPGTSDDNNYAIWAGQAARNRYKSMPNNPAVIGGYITDVNNFQPTSLRAVINGDASIRDRVGPVSLDGSANTGIFSFVTEEVSNACGGSYTPPPVEEPVDYQLTPIATADPQSVREGETVNFEHRVNNNNQDNASVTSNWKVYDVKIEPGFAVNPLDFGVTGSVCTNNGTNKWCDAVASCDDINAKIGNRGECSEVAGSAGSGRDTFPRGETPLSIANRSVSVGDERLGTRICSILVIEEPNLSGARNRASSAACAIVGKTPLVQIHGGDLRAGRQFVQDSNATNGDDAGIYTTTFRITQDITRTYGSWVEYGAFAPGGIEKIASQSGFAQVGGGLDGTVSGAVCDTQVNKLTFANVVSRAGATSRCGYYNKNYGPKIPDIVSAIATGGDQISGNSIAIDGSLSSGSHKKDTGNLEITGGSLQKGKWQVIYVPNGTVTISGDIEVDNAETYESISQVPQLIVIAKDIAIKEGVENVNAWLVAVGENEGTTGGVLDTCTGNTIEACKKPLKINGPVMAREIKLWRTTVKIDSCRILSANDCSDVGNPAETFNLPGSSLLWVMAARDRSAQARTTSTIELPPYF